MSANKISRGYVQVYTGDGKGKTTAALGVACRAAGAGLRIYFAQFAKGQHCSELNALQRFADLITVKRYGRKGFIGCRPTAADIAQVQAGLAAAAAVMSRGAYDLVVLDEANVAVNIGLLEIGELIAAVNGRAPGVEVIITGRHAHADLIEIADLVTEMRAVKHYYDAGVAARVGIEK